MSISNSSYFILRSHDDSNIAVTFGSSLAAAFEFTSNDTKPEWKYNIVAGFVI